MQRVLQLCLTSVNRYATLQKTSCIYDIPEFLIGYPVYDMNDCVSYLHQELVSRGFNITYIFPKIFVISWDMGEETPSRRPTYVDTRNHIDSSSQRSVEMIPKDDKPLRKQLLEGSSRSILTSVPTVVSRPQRLLNLSSAPRKVARKKKKKADDEQEEQPVQQGLVDAEQTNSKEIGIENMFVRSITDLKPSGRFTITLD